MFKKIILISAITLLSACTTYQVADNSAGYRTNKQLQGPFLSGNANVMALLAHSYTSWEGTRYRFGGMSKSGIDCSAFIQKVFSSAFQMEVPRNTSGQKLLGHRIDRNELREGDLVFFRNNHHVGIYIGNDEFIHASTSQGVTTTSLDDSYWGPRYTQARRILE